DAGGLPVWPWAGGRDPGVGPAAGAGGGLQVAAPATGIALSVPPKTDPPPLPEPVAARTLREIFRLTMNDARFGLGAVALFLVMVLLGLDGSVLAWLWAELVDGTGSLVWPAAGIVA